MLNIRDSVTSTMITYNNIIKQRETEIHNYNDLEITKEFYAKRLALENYFNAFNSFKNDEELNTYYDKNEDDYINAKNTYLDFIKKFLEIKNKIKVPKTRKEALETKTHINSVKTGTNDNIKDLIIKPVPNCPGYSFFFKALALKVW